MKFHNIILLSKHVFEVIEFIFLLFRPPPPWPRSEDAPGVMCLKISLHESREQNEFIILYVSIRSTENYKLLHVLSLLLACCDLRMMYWCIWISSAYLQLNPTPEFLKKEVKKEYSTIVYPVPYVLSRRRLE